MKHRNHLILGALVIVAATVVLLVALQPESKNLAVHGFGLAIATK